MIQQTDTIVAQTSQIIAFQEQERYNYSRSLGVEFDLWDWLLEQLAKLLRRIFRGEFVEDYSEPILIVLLILMAVAIIAFLIRKRPQLFMGSGKKTKMAYTVQEDHIYGVDFNAEISEALRLSDYKTAVRMLYLQTLKALDDAEVIDWQPYKTPTQYLYEVKQENGRAPFRQLTTGFLRVRYGNFEATAVMFDEMKSLQQTVLKGGKL